MKHLKLNGLIEKCRWEAIACCCGTEVMDKHPIKDCKHCKFDQAKQSCPTECFKVNVNVLDKEGKPTGKIIVKEITEINLKYGQVYQDLIGWEYSV